MKEECFMKAEVAAEKYLKFAENDYVNALVALLLIFTVWQDVLASFGQGLEGLRASKSKPSTGSCFSISISYFSRLLGSARRTLAREENGEASNP